MAQGALSGLSAQECAEIRDIYRITPPQCEGGAVAVSPGGTPAGALRENHVFFPKGGAQLDEDALRQIRALAQILQGRVMGNACLQLIGHSDSSGAAATNRRLALKRAEQVRDMLEAQLRSPGRVETVLSLGEEAPLTDFASTSIWQRRVEIRARSCPQA
jgi:outer membrane protein OmpA-like peptidoglycan-associated protein